ncbi:biotin carboxylase N-terminal domain-containing protein [Streptomyces sp. NPDC060064]|uniref:biotin carboxylase N-terminal domain-containing protein n=1 Tax=Streptomyces sp. NPDC060064 TaxID=3347049 RepID=UPI003676DF1F
MLRAAAEAGMRTAAVYAEDDAGSPHIQLADEALPLPGSGPALAALDAWPPEPDGAARRGAAAVRRHTVASASCGRRPSRRVSPPSRR